MKKYITSFIMMAMLAITIPFATATSASAQTRRYYRSAPVYTQQYQRPSYYKRHRNLINLISWHLQSYEVSQFDKAAQFAAQSFDASVWEIWPYLVSGNSIHIVSEEARHSIPHLLEWLADHEITIGFLPSLVAERVIDATQPEHLSLRKLLTGADRLNPITNPHVTFDVFNNYGPTEATVVSTWIKAELNGEPIPIGRPITNARVCILDKHLKPVPIGVSGELYIGGMGLARGRNLRVRIRFLYPFD